MVNNMFLLYDINKEHYLGYTDHLSFIWVSTEEREFFVDMKLFILRKEDINILKNKLNPIIPKGSNRITFGDRVFDFCIDTASIENMLLIPYANNHANFIKAFKL